MQYMRLIGLILAFAAVVPAAAQPPATDIWVADLQVAGEKMQVGTPRNVTHRPGYDNQPCFLPGGDAFLFVAADSSGRTDVFRFDLVAGTVTQVTRTAESEYSPTPLEAPELGFVTVRVEADSTQRLWRFDADGSNPRLVASEVDSVGYFALLGEQTVAVFIVGSPPTLRLVDIPTQRETVVARDVGRSILEIPGGRGMSFLAREADGTYAFYGLSSPTSGPWRIIDAVGDGQDAVWIGFTLVMAGGAKLFAAHVPEDPRWREIADLASAGVGKVTRIAVRGRRVAFVTPDPAP